uniref:RNA helicase n=1 Tax=Timema shepardi TaxID=629360 RepID=A0A7R9ALF4_TIMSH|nr:unnamed protein product [Timema shepardi]
MDGEFQVSNRAYQAIAKLGWLMPTLIQESAIPLLLEGKDVLLRARTGSGKTAAFAVPVIQKILNSKQETGENISWWRGGENHVQHFMTTSCFRKRSFSLRRGDEQHAQYSRATGSFVKRGFPQWRGGENHALYSMANHGHRFFREKRLFSVAERIVSSNRNFSSKKASPCHSISPLTVRFASYLLDKDELAREQAVKALVLAPSKELCQQIHSNFVDLTIKCSRELTCVDISAQDDVVVQRPLLVERPDVVVATPNRALLHLKANNLDLKTLEILVIDEADLVFSFGYEEEVKDVLSYLPQVYQAILASATLSEDVLTLKKLVLHNPVTLKLEEPDLAPATQLSHYHLYAQENQKATILYALLKLRLVTGKTIIFVNTVDKCYKLKLFLQQFAIPTCVLNSELPAAIRCLAVNHFNQGVYDIIIASDEKSLMEPHAFRAIKKKGVKLKRKKDKESGVARGIDFQCVSNVINFDFPLDVSSYIHRVGRTARGNNQASYTFVSPLFKEVALRISHSSLMSSDRMKPRAYQFKLNELESFNYRANDAWRAVTRTAVREARLKEIKQEIFNCKKLQGHFVDNPRDLQSLRHDKALHTVKVQSQLSNIPDYIVPTALKRVAGLSNSKKRRAPPSTKAPAKIRYQAIKDNPLLNMGLSGNTSKKKKRKHSINNS